MTFALRAIWVISPYEQIPLYERHFNTVEVRAKKLVANYVPITNSSSLVEAVLVETGVKKPDTFVENRDGCDRTCVAPAFQLNTSEGILSPVVVLQHRGLLLCGLPLTTSEPGNVQGSLHEVAQTMDCLNMIAEHLKDSISEKSVLRMNVTRLISISLPFGHPVCLNANLCEQLLHASLKDTALDKVKQPIWNPSTSKGKTQLLFHMSEQIHCEMSVYPSGENKPNISGTMWLNVGELPGNCPEISVTMSHPTKLGSMILSPRVQISAQSDSSTTLQINPTPNSRSAVCHYTTNCDTLPLTGTLDIHKADHEGNISDIKLVLQSSKVALQSLDVTLSRANLKSRSIKFSVGTAVEEGTNLRWEIPPSKLKSKPAELEATLLHENASNDNVLDYNAQVSFKIADQTWSGYKILPQSVAIIPSSKIKSSFTAEALAGCYIITSH